MPAFNYVARDANSGQEILNSIIAESQDAAIMTLLQRNHLVVAIEERKPAAARTSAGGKVSLKELVTFTRQLATMVDAGMAIVGCLRSLYKQTSGKVMQDIIRDISTRVETGDGFSDALSKHPKVFDSLYLSMVSAGEKSGMLAEALGRVATHLESVARLRRKVKSAMMYPAVVIVVAFAITVFLLVKVVPVFGEIYSGFRGRLPAPTQALIDFSNFVKTWFIPILLGIGAAIYGWIKFVQTPAGRLFYDANRIRVPIFGKIAHQICLARFARTFSSLVRSGVPILSVLQSVAKSCNNVVMEKAVNQCTFDITTGSGISESLGKHPVFPEMVVNMISAGEQTGKMDEMLKRIADHLDDEVETALQGLTSLIEPIIIVVLGVILGTVVICMFLPIFKLADLVSGR